MDIEKVYQKKSQLEHILLRPDTYIGSVEMLEQEMWIWDCENEKMMKKEIKFVPGLYKIFDEILVNAADNKQRDPNMSLIRINIDKENNSIRIYNNGRGIPVVEHKEEKVLVPTLIFGHLLTSSNYNDDEKKVTGGRNGYGAKLCNIFSKKFVLETSSKEYKKSFKQVWTNNMSKAEDPVMKDAKDEDFTCITFVPDLAKFKMSCLDDDTVALMARRAYDIAASSPGVKVYLNDKRLPVSKFEDYCKLYLTNELDETGSPPKLIYEKVNERWEVAVACSDIGFQQVSFVNSIATTKGGRHVDYIADQLIKHLTELVNKKNKGSAVKPFQIKNHMWLFVNCLIENPTFDSQTKENMTLQAKNFGSKCALADDFYKRVTKSGLLERILTWMAFKEKTDLEKVGSKSKQSKIKGIPKLDDANDAGTKDSLNCTLIVTEGDSAKTLAVAGLGVIGRDKYGVFPLRGKMLNVREATTRQVIENSEISSLLKIIGLNFKEKYESRDSLKQLRYGKLMIMTDQDHDGSHIKGLIINFIHYQWPNLLKHGFVEEFITPIVKVSKGHSEKSFYSMPEFEEWQQNTDNWNTWKIKYYKGLGTSTSKEAKEYFSDMKRHRIAFDYTSARDDLAIQLAFSKKFIDERKDWLTRFMEERKMRRETQAPDDYLYQKDTKGITYTDFINKELVLFSNLDNERSIPCLVDGFKPGQRKVMFTCFKRNLVKELKVAQLAGSVAELSSYHHGEQSLMSTIINLAQNYVGANNINLLLPIGQFGTRLHGGKDAASPRYIFTAMHPLTRLLFNPKDDPLYAYLNDDGQRVEPEWYCPILPTVLINGAEGIGTGWSTKIPNYNPRELVDNLRLMIDGENPKTMVPYYKNFRGKIERVDDIRVLTNGEIAIIGDQTIEITELPIGVWTQHYKETVLEAYLHGAEKADKTTGPTLITDYKEYHTDTTVRFVVKMSPEQFRNAEATGMHKYFKLQKALSLNSMVLFDRNGCLRRYESVAEILREFFEVRADLYKKRKAYMEGTLEAESLKLDNIARFILEKIEGKIKVENLKKTEIIRILRERGYNPDPVAKWKKKVAREQGLEDQDAPQNQAQEEEEEAITVDPSTHDFDYLLGMPIWNLTMEKKEEILRQQKQKGDELKALKAKTHLRLWKDDLDQFLAELDKYEQKEKEDDEAAQLKAFKAGLAGKAGGAGSKRPAAASKMGTRMEYMPSADGIKVEAQIDPSLITKASTTTKEPTQQVKKELSVVDIITNSGSEARQMAEEEIIRFASNLGKPAKAAAKEPKKPAEKRPKAEKGVKAENNDDNDDVHELSDSNDGLAKRARNDDDGDDSRATVAKKPAAAAKKSKSPASKKSPKPKATAAATATSKAKATKAEAKGSIINFFKKKPKKDDDSLDESDLVELSGSDDDSSLELDEPVERRVIGRARKEVKYNVFCEDEESSKDSAASVVPVKPAKKKKMASDDDEDDDFVVEKEFSSKSTTSKAAPAKKTTTKFASDDDEEDFVVEKETCSKPAGSKAAPAKKTTKVASDDDGNDDDYVVSSKSSGSKTTTAKKADLPGFDTDDDDASGHSDESDDDFAFKPAAKKKKDAASPARKVLGSKTAEAKKPAPKRATVLDSDDEDSENIPPPPVAAKKAPAEKPKEKEKKAPAEKKPAAKPAPAPAKSKKKYSDSEDDADVISDDSDSDFDAKPKPAKKKLMPANKADVAEIFKKTKTAAATAAVAKKTSKKAMDSDDDLYAID